MPLMFDTAFFVSSFMKKGRMNIICHNMVVHKLNLENQEYFYERIGYQPLKIFFYSVKNYN